MPLGIWCGIVIVILAYNFVFKAAPAMGIIRSLNVLLGAAAGWSEGEIDRLQIGLVLAIPAFTYVTALTFVSTLEEGKIRLPVIAVGATFMVLGAFAPGLARLAVGLEVASEGWIVSAFLACWIVWRSMLARERRGVMMIVRDGVAGIIILDAAILCAAGFVDQGIVVAALIFPAALFVGLFKKVS